MSKEYKHIGDVARAITYKKYLERNSRGKEDKKRIEEMESELQNVDYRGFLEDSVERFNDLGSVSLGVTISIYKIGVGENLKDLAIKLKELQEIQGAIFDKRGDNKIYLSDTYGNLYSMILRYNDYPAGKTITLDVWNSTGGTALFSSEWDVEEGISKEEKDMLVNTLDKYSKGYIKCSGCGEWVSKDEIGGGIFASRYCNKCWENEYREKESKMNYN